MAVIFMTGYKKSTKETMIVPVFRLKKDDESDTKYSLYVDLIGRVYQDWTDLMQNNVFLQWWICLPTFGMYTYDGEVQLIFQDQSEWGKVLKNIDKASTISRSVSYHIYISTCKQKSNKRLSVFVQVNLCQKLLFLHQLTHNMWTDCSLFMKIVSSEYLQNMCTHIFADLQYTPLWTDLVKMFFRKLRQVSSFFFERTLGPFRGRRGQTTSKSKMTKFLNKNL